MSNEKKTKTKIVILKYNEEEVLKAKKFSLVIDEVIDKLSKEQKAEIAKDGEFFSNPMQFQMGLGLNLRNTILKEERVANQIPYYDPIYTDCYSSAVLKLVGRKLKERILFCDWILCDCNCIESGFFSISQLENLSIRSRTMAAIYCIEQLYENSDTNKNQYKFVINILSKYIECEKTGEWHYPYSEITPSSILHDKYNSESFEVIKLEDHTKLKSLYVNSSKDILNSIEDLFEISTKDLYSSITNMSQYTLKKLVNIYIRLIKNKLKPVQFRIEDATSIDEKSGWGNNIKYRQFQKMKLN